MLNSVLPSLIKEIECLVLNYPLYLKHSQAKQNTNQNQYKTLGKRYLLFLEQNL